MELYYKQELTVGALVLAAIAVLVVGLMWLTGQTFRTGRRVMVPVQFAMVGGLTEGDPVQISGVSVGRVAQVELEEVGRVLVRLEVSKKVRPRVDATAEIKPLDFLGAKYVAYSPGEAEALLPEGEAIKGVVESDLASSAARVADETGRLLLRSQALLSDSMVMQMRRTLEAAEQALTAAARVGSGAIVGDASAALVSLRGAANALDSTISNPAISESISQLDEVTESVREMTEGLAAATQNLADLLKAMRSPDGSMGRMLTDTTLYVDMHETLVSLRKLLDDIRERPGRYINVTVF